MNDVPSIVRGVNGFVTTVLKTYELNTAIKSKVLKIGMIVVTSFMEGEDPFKRSILSTRTSSSLVFNRGSVKRV